jgi:hypothetical protein
MRRNRITLTRSSAWSLASRASRLTRDESLPEIFSMMTFPGATPAEVSAPYRLSGHHGSNVTVG